MASRTTALVALLALYGTAWAQTTAAHRTIAIKAGRVLTISGAEIDNGVVLIEDGRITAVGAGLEVPWDANVIDASDKVVMPGFVEAHTSEGISTANEQVQETPFLNTIDGIDPLSWYMEDTLRGGITTQLVLPGNSTVIGGTGVVIRPCGRTIEGAVVRPYTGMKLSLLPRGDSNRPAHVARLRDYFARLREYLAQYAQRKEDAAAAKKPFDEKPDPMRQPVIDLIEGRLTAFIYCPSAADAVRALALAKELSLPEVVLVLAGDSWKAATALAEAQVPVVLDAETTFWQTDEETETVRKVFIPKVFADAGVRFALSRGGGSFETQQLWIQAARAVAAGVDRATALRSVTLTAAEIIGVAERLGSVEVGKDANLLILTGDPLEATSWVDKVLIEGEVVYEREKDARLAELLAQPVAPEAPPAESPEGGGGQ